MHTDWRWLSALAALAVLAVGSGCSGDPREHTVEVRSGVYRVDGARALSLDCLGAGRAPLVVLQPGLGNTSVIFTTVMQRLAAERVPSCAVNRAGVGASGDHPGPHDAAAAAADTLAALRSAHVSPPYVMVGASYGGLVVQELARTSPRAVAGVVLVDALHPELDARIARVLGPRRTAERAHELVTDIGEPVTFADLLASDREVETAGAFPEVPLVVLSHGEPFASFDPTYPTAAVEALWQRLERALATLSPCSVFTEVPGAHHRIHTDRPDAVVAAIDATLAAVRRARPGQPCRRPSVRFG